MPDIPPTSPARLGVFLAAEAAVVGWSSDQLERATRGRRLVRVRRGAYAPALEESTRRFTEAELTRARRAVAATLTNRAAIVSHLAAATVRGWTIWAPPNAPACIVVPIGNVRATKLHEHRGLGSPGDFVRRGDVRMTAAGRTVVDIAREFGTESALVTADAALARGELDRLALAAAADSAAGRAGVERARELLDLVDPLAESPLESRSRWRLHEHGVSEPITQVEIYDLDGNFLGRGDFYWPEGVIGEVDGSMKYTDLSVLRREKWRQEKLERTRLRVVRWGSSDLTQFGPTAARIERARHEAREDVRPRGWWAVHPDVDVAS